MSPTLLANLRAAERATRALHWQVQRTYGDDGTRYPRDYYAPIRQLGLLRPTTRLLADLNEVA